MPAQKSLHGTIGERPWGIHREAKLPCHASGQLPVRPGVSLIPEHQRKASNGNQLPYPGAWQHSYSKNRPYTSKLTQPNLGLKLLIIHVPQSIFHLDALHDTIPFEQVIHVMATLLPLPPTIGLHIASPHHKREPGKSLQDQHLTL
jgi:hypothetical protein